MAQERLQKFLSECSVASRRKSEELIREGKVRVNGKIAQIGDKVDPKKDTVTVSGKKVVASTTIKPARKPRTTTKTTKAKTTKKSTKK